MPKLPKYNIDDDNEKKDSDSDSTKVSSNEELLHTVFAAKHHRLALHFCTRFYDIVASARVKGVWRYVSTKHNQVQEKDNISYNVDPDNVDDAEIGYYYDSDAESGYI